MLTRLELAKTFRTDAEGLVSAPAYALQESAPREAVDRIHMNIQHLGGLAPGNDMIELFDLLQGRSRLALEDGNRRIGEKRVVVRISPQDRADGVFSSFVHFDLPQYDLPYIFILLAHAKKPSYLSLRSLNEESRDPINQRSRLVSGVSTPDSQEASYYTKSIT